MQTSFDQLLSWTHRHMPRLQRALAALPDLSEMRLACSMHLDLKIVPLVEGLLDHHAQVFLVTCNPVTVRDKVVEYLQSKGAHIQAWRDMPHNDYAQAIEAALQWEPTHLCELGADLSAALKNRPPAGSSDPQNRQHRRGPVLAGLEGTGSGIARLSGFTPPYPIFNWDDLPAKEGLHNRHMVGLSTWHTFFTRTQLTLHGKRVAVIGYGLVGQGVAATARAYGGAVTIVERDPSRALQAAYDGWQVATLDQTLSSADVVVTCTGASNVLTAEHFSSLKNGVFLLNVGHESAEIDVPTLYAHPHQEVLPFVDEIHLGERSIFLFAGGSMANLTAGQGDSLNAFDLTLAILTSGIGFIATEGAVYPPGIHLLPRPIWEPYIT